MTRVYRILRRPYSKNPFDGEGAYRFGGRWSSPGTRIVYTSEHLSLAMLEYFVHVDPNEPPNDLVVVIAEVPDNISRFFVSGNRLPKLWRQTPVLPELKTIGDDFVQQGEAAILVVPSALAPVESNWLINPLHPDFRKIRIRPPEPFDYDSRFFTETK